MDAGRSAQILAIVGITLENPTVKAISTPQGRTDPRNQVGGGFLSSKGEGREGFPAGDSEKSGLYKQVRPDGRD
jgi:hypothetical protein